MDTLLNRIDKMLGFPRAPWETAEPARAKQKVFFSYYRSNEPEAIRFLQKWVVNESFLPMIRGVSESDGFIRNKNREFVLDQIRKRYLRDSTVTIVLIGPHTHSLRFVDWEIQASLRESYMQPPNGLIGIVLPPYDGYNLNLPMRLKDNWHDRSKACYARLYYSPTSVEELEGWIEDAHASRIERSGLINNNRKSME